MLATYFASDQFAVEQCLELLVSKGKHALPLFPNLDTIPHRNLAGLRACCALVFECTFRVKDDRR